MDKLNPQFHNAKHLFKIIMPELVSVLYLTDLINQHSLVIVLYVDYFSLCNRHGQGPG